MKKTAFFIIIGLIAISWTCPKKIGGIYRYFWGKNDNYNIWIIDGNRVRQKIYKEWLYGGNEQRYIFNPKGEIWIDNAISCEEFDLTVAHELNERHLMAKFGWTYEAAHDSSLCLEQVTLEQIDDAFSACFTSPYAAHLEKFNLYFGNLPPSLP